MTDEQLDIQLRSYMQNVPGALHGVVVKITEITDANTLYFFLEDVYKKMFNDLREQKHISEGTGDFTENFAIVGFPRFIHQLPLLSHVMLFIARQPAKGVWSTELVFHYKGDSTITYRSQILA